VHETLVVRDLELARGDRVVLRSVSLDVRPGEICALMGESGTGKSTLLRVVAALEPFRAGTVSIGEVALRPGPLPRESQLRALRRRVGFVFQSSALFEHLTALENVALAPLHALGWTRERAESTGRELLTALGVGARLEAYPRELSGGEAQRVAIARALAPDPSLLLMDEPTAALDPARRASLGELLRRLAADGRALLVATHDLDFAREVADRVVVLDDGVVRGEGLWAGG